jgi:Integrase core domain
VTKTHSRPHVSNDNPFSEAQFKTLKYRPDFPARFGAIQDARAHCHVFFPWYNTEHRHSGLGLLTPADVHHGLTDRDRHRTPPLPPVIGIGVPLEQLAAGAGPRRGPGVTSRPRQGTHLPCLRPALEDGRNLGKQGLPPEDERERTEFQSCDTILIGMVPACKDDHRHPDVSIADLTE